MKKEIYCSRFNNSLSSYYLTEDFVAPNFNLILSPQGPPHPDQILLLSIPWQIDGMLINFLQQGGRCIIDGLWEGLITKDLSLIMPWRDQILILTAADCQNTQGFSTVSVPQWFWYSESLWYKSLGYDQYIPDFNHKIKKFFMPIRKSKPFRDRFFSLIKSQITDAIWSYVEQGTRLPGYPEDHDPEDQRYFNPVWYDQTWFSMVLETTVNINEPTFVTEKTCKPLAYSHPFLLLAQPNSLSQIRSWGFETFPEIFDESYDQVRDTNQRMEKIAQEVRQFRPADYPGIIKEKLWYNRDLFFNTDLIQTKINQQLIKPLLEFIDS